jgi:hypothetical protein
LQGRSVRGRSEPLGADEGEGEVGEETGGRERAEDEVEGHGSLSEAFAERDVAGGEHEEREARGDEDDVEHGADIRSLGVRSAWRERDAWTEVSAGTPLGFERGTGPFV